MELASAILAGAMLVCQEKAIWPSKMAAEPKQNTPNEQVPRKFRQLFRIVQVNAWKSLWRKFLSRHVVGKIWRLIFVFVQLVVFVLCERKTKALSFDIPRIIPQIKKYDQNQTCMRSRGYCKRRLIDLNVPDAHITTENSPSRVFIWTCLCSHFRVPLWSPSSISSPFFAEFPPRPEPLVPWFLPTLPVTLDLPSGLVFRLFRDVAGELGTMSCRSACLDSSITSSLVWTTTSSLSGSARGCRAIIGWVSIWTSCCGSNIVSTSTSTSPTPGSWWSAMLAFVAAERNSLRQKPPNTRSPFHRPIKFLQFSNSFVII